MHSSNVTRKSLTAGVAKQEGCQKLVNWKFVSIGYEGKMGRIRDPFVTEGSKWLVKGERFC